jgi:Neuraminidase (sialidase)
MTVQSPTKTIDIRSLPHTREVIAYRNGGQFPVLTATADGTVIAVLRGAAGHLGIQGRIDIVRSLDGGQTWTYPNIVADSERDDRNPGFGVSAQGTLIVAYTSTRAYDEAGKYAPPSNNEDRPKYWDMLISRSTDNGLTWQEPYRLS